VTEAKKPASVKNLVDRVGEIREGLVQTLRTLRERINMLETERGSLLLEIEKIKKAAETRANNLETEISDLRKEIEAMKELLGSAELKE
jgi:uncharacterized coiled-coil DUF342 family protein